MPFDATSSRAGDKVHDACSTCHQASGVLQGGNTTYGNQPIAKGDCGTCHTAAYFDSHVHGVDGGYIDHSVSFNSSVDRSQNNDIAANACNQCHTNNDDASAPPLDSWTDIIGEHETGCARCHSYTDGGDGTPTQAQNDNAIAAGRTAATCITCHVKKDHASGASSVHGGHGATDFAWTGATTTSCGTADCHDAATNTDVIGQIHNGRFAAQQTSNCKNCHDNDGGGAGSTWVGPTDGDADATNAGSNKSSICTVCHTGTLPAIHHVTNASIPTQYAQDGECVTCHLPDVNQPVGEKVAARGDIAMPANMPCGVCHLYFPGFANDGAGTYETDGSSKVIIYELTFDANNGPGALPSMSASTTHAVSENTTTPISDYAACFACHGATAFVGTSGTSTSALPFHGLGTPLVTANTNDDLDPGVTVNGGTGGNYDDIINFYGGPNVDWYPDAPQRTFAWHPGFGLLNWLALEVGFGSKGNASYGNATGISPGISPNDGTARQPGDRVCVPSSGPTTFNIPWDSYSDGVITTPVATALTMDKDYGFKGTITTDITVPLVDLGLAVGNCPLLTTGTWYSGPENGGKNSAGTVVADTVYVLPDQFTTLETGATTGSVTLIEFQNGGSTVTLMSGSISGGTFTVRDAISTDDDTAITVGDLIINDGDYIAVYFDSSSGGDTQFDTVQEWGATDAGQPVVMKTTDGSITSAPVATDTFTVADWPTIYNNMRATVVFDAYK